MHERADHRRPTSTLILLLLIAGAFGACQAPEAADEGAGLDNTRQAFTAADLLALTNSCVQASNGKYATDSGGAATVPICKLNNAYFWKADLDVDCDGLQTTTCNKQTDPDFQNQTSAT